jgi:hypothetical protein
VDILDDPKIKKMSDKTYRIFTYLLLFVRQQDGEGVVNMNLEEISWRLRLPKKHLEKAIADLKSLKIMSTDSEGIEFINWKKRQYKSDNVSARVNSFRHKDETLLKTFQITLENRTDTEQIQKRADKEKKELFNNTTKEAGHIREAQTLQRTPEDEKRGLENIRAIIQKISPGDKSTTGQE